MGIQKLFLTYKNCFVNNVLINGERRKKSTLN